MTERETEAETERGAESGGFSFAPDLRWSRPTDVGVVDGSSPEQDDGPLYVAPLPDGPILVLEGVTKAFYQAVMGTDGDPVAVIDHLATALEVAVADIDLEAVADLADALSEQRILRQDSGDSR